MSWFDNLFKGRAAAPQPEIVHTDFQDNYPGKTGEGGVPGSTSTAKPILPIRRMVTRNFQEQGDSGGRVEEGTIAFRDAQWHGGPGNQGSTPIAQQGHRERQYHTPVVGNLNLTWPGTRTDTPQGHADLWTPQATGSYLPAEGTGHPLSLAGPGFSRPVPGAPRVSEGRRKIYLTGEVQDFGQAAAIVALGIQPMTGTGRTRIRPQTWWEEPAPYFSNYYLSGPQGTPAAPMRDENAAQAQTAGTGATSRRDTHRQRRT